MDKFITGAKAFLLFAWDLIIPRFITEDVALNHISGPKDEIASYEIACSLCDVFPGEAFDAVATVDAFQFLGFGITYRVGEARPFVNPHGVVYECD